MDAAQQTVVSRIRSLRGLKVILGADLADLYGVPTKTLIQAVKRNRDRFPSDFCFQLMEQEAKALRSQIVTLDVRRSSGRGKHFKYTPYAFTEQGVAMLSSVLRSRQAVKVNVEIMRAFVRLRGLMQHKRRACAKTRRAGSEIRPAIQGRVRCDPRADDSADDPEAQDRVLAHPGQHALHVAHHALQVAALHHLHHLLHLLELIE